MIADGNVSAIELQGIVRNRTKIGVEDGQAEDLLNLRFVNGSWRSSGDGRQVYSMSDNASGYTYTQVYIHTNIYRHVLGVRDGKLWWFANIDTDGVTFSPLDTPVELCDVVGDLWLTQTGHLLTIIDEAGSFEFYLFITKDNTYQYIEVENNDYETNRKLYPFGQIHFNLTNNGIGTIRESGTQLPDPSPSSYVDGAYDVNESLLAEKGYTVKVIHDKMISMYAAQTEKNRFTKPFLVCAAVKDYTGVWHYASPPMLMHFNENQWRMSRVHGKKILYSDHFIAGDGYYVDDNNNNVLENYTAPTPFTQWLDEQYTQTSNYFHVPNAMFIFKAGQADPSLKIVQWDAYIGGDGLQSTTGADSTRTDGATFYRAEANPIFSAGIHIRQYAAANPYERVPNYQISPANLLMSFDSDLVDFIQKNEAVFPSVGIFVTKEVDEYIMSEQADGNAKNGTLQYRFCPEGHSFFGYYKPYVRKNSDVIHDLTHSPFFLLREFDWKELRAMQGNKLVDLSAAKYNNVLKNIEQQNRLGIEATSRTTYLPKVSYLYNARLHIANYRSFPYYGYPIDLFHLNNHSLKLSAGNYFKGVLENLADDNDEYRQFHRNNTNMTTYADLIEEGTPYFMIRVFFKTERGEKMVVRYIPAYDTTTPVAGRADFIEDLTPLLTYPDARATMMEVYYVSNYSTAAQTRGVLAKYKQFELEPHPYMDCAYYIDSNLKPIVLDDFEDVYMIWQEQSQSFRRPTPYEVKELASMEYISEDFPNGLKVSGTQNPMVFPVENTYQVGSAEILALCSNAIAVGTGQTGSAPLYVFCKDGIYALFVDASGEMTYTNARVIARDVCNNPRSVTPTDQGVAFTTDRGLMMIAGEQVVEIGEPAEGDVKQYWNNSSIDFTKIAKGALTKVADFPTYLGDSTDFLTYIKDGAIVNYNHNERELMISNPNKYYSYVLDREGNWSRRDYTADQYVNNYPTSYRLVNGEFYKVDEEGTDDTPLEGKKEADNRFFYLSNVIKLGSIGFKEAHRFVVRGYFETPDTMLISKQHKTGNDTLGDTPRLEILYSSISGINKFPSGRNPYYMQGRKYRVSCKNNGSDPIQFALSFKKGSDGETPYRDLFIEDSEGERYIQSGETLTAEITSPPNSTVTSHGNITGVYAFIFSGTQGTPVGEYDVEYTIEEVLVNPHVGCYVLGSYDGRKWAMLGGNEKTGTFTDIGCKIERTDVKFIRICLAGQVSGKTRVDYMEISANRSVLNTKIR